MSDNNGAGKDLVTSELSMSMRFMNHVVQEYGNGVGEVALTRFQKRLAQNYFMSIDEALAKQEQRRNTAKESVPATWANVNMQRLAQDVVACARIGLDPMENNHISPVIYKNNRTGKYDIGFITRYKGIELKAKKYGLDCPDSVIIELVHSTDKFKSIKKSASNKVESYEFEITNEFARGDIVGGFFYLIYADKPEKNKLVVMSKSDIDKRKPKYASGEFWGGEIDQWETDEATGKRVKKKVVTEGWYEKMAYKTLHRAAYSSITIDSQKIDDDYRRLSAAEAIGGGDDFDADYQTNANSVPLESIKVAEGAVVDGESLDPATGEILNADDQEPGASKPPFMVAED